MWEGAKETGKGQSSVQFHKPGIHGFSLRNSQVHFRLYQYGKAILMLDEIVLKPLQCIDELENW